MRDNHVDAVRAKLLQRSKIGMQKYRTTTCQNDLSFEQWCKHAQEESLDHAVYMERVMSDYRKAMQRKYDFILWYNEKIQDLLPDEVAKEFRAKIINL